ncbi:restriction endonuclease subunit S [Hyphomonas sp.]|uniref:restriction endonuclease subunit S n=1 Tax=Hyphomonas sp. TaxID=87 RepID=UPI0025C3D36A|nr:restriction endonuclease subunit S [Hyphomonas sp.]
MTASLRLGDHCLKIGSGATPRGGKEAYLAEGPFSLIRSQNVLNDRFSFSGLAFISQDQADQLSNVEVQPGDVLLNITGDSVARVCQVDPIVLPARVNQHVAIIRPNPEVIDPRFLRYFLVSPEMQAHMLGLAASGATRNALTKGMIEKFEIPAVPLPEQRAIANTLGALDDKIELNRKMNETLEAMARALFRDWFVDFGPTRAKMEGRPAYLSEDLWSLFPDRLDDEGKPEGWAAGTLNDLASLNPESWTARNAPARVSYVDLANTKWGSIDKVENYAWADAPSRARRILRAGDTIVGTVRPGNGSFCYVAEDGLTGSTGFAVLRPKNARDRVFVWCASTSVENINRLNHLADGGAYPAVRPDAVAATEIVIPSEVVLAAFRDALSANVELIGTNNAESRTLAQTRDLLLPRLISGELKMEVARTAEGVSL